MNTIYPYGGFWKRVGALFIDNIVVHLATTFFFQILLLFFGSPLTRWTEQLQKAESLDAQTAGQFVGISLGIITLTFIIQAVYFAWMESSKYQATLGKMALKIKVVNAQGNRITFGHAFLRYLGKMFLGIFTFNIGYMMAGATRKKQALHDKLVHTYVVDTNFKPGDNLPEVQTHFGWLTAAIVGEFLALLSFMLVAWGIILIVIQAVQTQPVPPTAESSVQEVQNRLQELAATQAAVPAGAQPDGVRYFRHADGYRALLPNSVTLFLPNGQTDVCCEEDTADNCQQTGLTVCQK